jgi:hypothetical protein
VASSLRSDWPAVAVAVAVAPARRRGNCRHP